MECSKSGKSRDRQDQVEEPLKFIMMKDPRCASSLAAIHSDLFRGKGTVEAVPSPLMGLLVKKNLYIREVFQSTRLTLVSGYFHA